ncbi:MAG: hypothetical protein JXR78_01770 [Victivallales bacterium]|nr:hypothetical protein [Victivallales bacterium]
MPADAETQLQVLETCGRAFDRDIVYKKSMSLNQMIERNWGDALKSLYRESNGWFPSDHDHPVEFSATICQPEELQERLMDFCDGVEHFTFPLMFISASGCCWYDITDGINHLRAAGMDLDDAALMLLFRSPVSVYTPARMYDNIVAGEWYGEDNESARLEEFAYDDPDTEYEGLTRKQLLEVYPEYLLNFNITPLNNPEIWEWEYTPPAMKGLKEAIDRYYASCCTSQAYDWGVIPCAAAYYGRDAGYDIMSRIIDSEVDNAQQCGMELIAAHVVVLNPDYPEQVANHIKAYLDCLYWTGELLEYLGGNRNAIEVRIGG